MLGSVEALGLQQSRLLRGLCWPRGEQPLTAIQHRQRWEQPGPFTAQKLPDAACPSRAGQHTRSPAVALGDCRDGLCAYFWGRPYS